MFVTTWGSGMGWEVERGFKKGHSSEYLWLIHVDVWQRIYFKKYCKKIQ